MFAHIRLIKYFVQIEHDISNTIIIIYIANIKYNTFLFLSFMLFWILFCWKCFLIYVFGFFIFSLLWVNISSYSFYLLFHSRTRRKKYHYLMPAFLIMNHESFCQKKIYEWIIINIVLLLLEHTKYVQLTIWHLFHTPNEWIDTLFDPMNLITNENDVHTMFLWHSMMWICSRLLFHLLQERRTLAISKFHMWFWLITCSLQEITTFCRWLSSVRCIWNNAMVFFSAQKSSIQWIIIDIMNPSNSNKNCSLFTSSVSIIIFHLFSFVLRLNRGSFSLFQSKQTL